MQVKERVVILANGRFPEGDLPLGYLKSADKIICCDGAVASLQAYGLEPAVIVGDMDSISSELAEKYAGIMICDRDDQDSNDLTKAVRYCISCNITEIVILGATGLREDHTIGNISLLLEYSDFLNVKMVSDFGIFLCVQSGDKVTSYPGQQISIFSNRSELAVSSSGLKYPLKDTRLPNWWRGTLNECLSDSFSLSFGSDRILVFLEY